MMQMLEPAAKQLAEQLAEPTQSISAVTPPQAAGTLPMMRFMEESTMANAPSPEAMSGFAGLFDGMRFTVVRIQAIVGKVDWLQPYKQPSDSPFIGSGFVVDTGTGTEDPVFLTNAHVVQDARVVQVQLPAIGQMIFDAYVPLICKRFDLAVVQLKDPKAFKEAMAQHNGTMHALPVRPSMVSLGLEVAAVGFPLGSSSLKLSRGIISGTEMVDSTICYQSTAPISPGSSGGPLFAVNSEKGDLGKAEDLQVIGVNFASSSSEGAQNVNYVVPTIHLLQVLHEFRQLKFNIARQANSSDTQMTASGSVGVSGATSGGVAVLAGEHRQVRAGSPHQHRDHGKGHKKAAVESIAASPEVRKAQKKYPHFQLRIAPIDAIGIESSEALYSTSGGCQKGVFLSRILPTSALRFAKPPVPERSFLTWVDNVTIDSFGMGRTANFLGDPTPFESLMLLRETLDDMVTLTICQHGRETQHVVSIRWRPEFEVAVQDIEEPHFEESATSFEIFAGVTIMQMTSNHIVELLKSGRPQTLSRWLLIENQEVPRLIITHVEEGTYASRVLTSGMVIQKINGQNVSTLAELRERFQPQGIAWTLETDRGLLFSVQFKETLIEQVNAAASATQLHYLLSEGAMQAAKNLKLIDHTGLLQYDTEAAPAPRGFLAASPRPRLRATSSRAGGAVLLQVSQHLSADSEQCPLEEQFPSEEI
jgi:S1-C subfamily serine protease